jgi:enediyne polyketide synthase
MDGRAEHNGAIAITGIACQFPGAHDPAEFHELTVAGRRMFRPVPGASGYALHAALLDGWMTPGEVTPGHGDVAPLRKLTSETIALALADAGLRDAGGRAGLLIASSVPEVREGTEQFPAATCHSSLHAIAAACDALAAGDLDLVVAGGAELGIDRDWLARQAAAGNLGVNQMRIYDAAPAGLLPGDGCGIVVLVRAADARAAGRPAYAEIAGWTAEPGLPVRAYEQAQVDPAGMHLVEGHGAGTAADDAELAVLARLRQGGAGVAALGAVSASIGHTRSAAGVASLIKTVTAMVAGTIPPGTRCPHPHPLIESGDARLRLPDAPYPWPDGQRLAAVNSIGSDDPDAAAVHLVLRREPDSGGGHGRRRRTAQAHEPQHTSPGRHAGTPPAPAAVPPPATTHARYREAPPTIFALCGAEAATIAATLDVIAASAGGLADADLGDLARHLASASLRNAERRAPMRVTVMAASTAELATQARRTARLLRGPAASMTLRPGISFSTDATGSVVLVFPGLAWTAAEHTALLAGSLDALRTLGRLGVSAAAAVGYSFGEVTGLVWAGCLPATEGARLAALRGQVLRSCAARPTAMARVTADVALVRHLCALYRLHVAAYETPTSHLLAGPADGIRDLARRGAETGFAVEVLAGSTAMHSPALDGCVAPLRAVLAGTPFTHPRRRLISATTGEPITPADDLADLLAGQLSRPVLFGTAMAAAASGADLLVVAGPDADPAHPHTSLAKLAAAACGVPAIGVPPATDAAVTQTMATLFTAGAVNDLTSFVTSAPAAPRPAATVPAAWTVPPARDGQSADGQRATTVRSEKTVLMG